MIKYSLYSKDLRIHADYVFDKEQKLIEILPYLYPKISGEWYIVLLLPKLSIVETLVIPQYITLEVFLDNAAMDKLLLEHPSLVVSTKSVFEQFMDLIAECEKVVDHNVPNLIYKRVGPNIETLKETLDTLVAKSKGETITMRDVYRYIPNNQKVYASNVAYAFLTNSDKRWQLLDSYVQELGEMIAFYALRKYLRKLLEEKVKYLHNEDTKTKVVTKIDALSISKLLYCFEMSINTKQLYIALIIYDNHLEDFYADIQSGKILSG